MVDKVKRCSQGDHCVHPDGPLLPWSEFTMRTSGYPMPSCKKCRASASRRDTSDTMYHDTAIHVSEIVGWVMSELRKELDIFRQEVAAQIEDLRQDVMERIDDLESRITSQPQKLDISVETHPAPVHDERYERVANKLLNIDFSALSDPKH